MKRWLRSVWLWLGVLVLAVAGGLVFLGSNTGKILYPALDTLSKVQLADRASHPELLKIRELGPKAVPPLRSVLRESERPSTRVLLWVKQKWPGESKYYSHFPDVSKMRERRQTACEVLCTLGPAGRAAAPELIDIFRKGDRLDSNVASSAVWAIGIDADICERLNAVMEEKGVPELGSRFQIVTMLGRVKPPSERTLRVLSVALSDPSPMVVSRVVQTVGHLGVPNPGIISALRQLQSSTTNELVIVSSSAALWELEKDAGTAFDPIMRVLTNALARLTVRPVRGGDGGEVITHDEELFMGASDLFQQMRPGEPDKARALALMEAWCERSGRIFVRMLLLPGMMELGFPREKCVEVCETGLRQEGISYRLHAARLLTKVSEKHGASGLDIDTLIHDPYVGVRVYASKIHWETKKQSGVVVPVLIEALDRAKHQSYYYDSEILPAALNALGDLGPQAAAATAALTVISHDPNPAVAKLAAEALSKIQRR